MRDGNFHRAAAVGAQALHGALLGLFLIQHPFAYRLFVQHGYVAFGEFGLFQ